MRDRWIGSFGLIAALAVFPLPTEGSTPEIASIVAVAAIALLAGQRWALPIVVLADLALVGALWPRAFHDPPDPLAQLGLCLGLIGALPGAASLSRAAQPLAELVTGRASDRRRRIAHAAIVLCAAVWLAGPLL